ncbi:Conserved hypothetical protein [Micromonospora lupini str. Lupac 08]|uniref:PknH-like extracellular domain-containing protein n=2 Tax=Micromonospora lupini TaxID=285679 RepID=I0L5M5_9ACTN|nr:Conserved hypothetical protein [Micromonospora lupini str. Lupac 08]
MGNEGENMSRHALPPTARALILPLLGTVALTTACTSGGDESDPVSSAAAPTTASAGTSPADPPSASASAPTTIPTSAFVELPAELRKSPRRTTPVEEALPKLCGNEFGTGGRQVTASAAMTVTYQKPGDSAGNTPQGLIHQTIFTFEGAGAADYMRRLRSAVEACPSYDRGGNPVKVASKPLSGVGDEAVLVSLTRAATDLNGDRNGGTTSTQIAVARVDGAVTVFNDQGWEGSSGNPAVLDQTVRDGVKTIDAWQR